MQRMEHRLGRSLAEFFEERYHRDGLTMAQIASELDLNVGTISRWMAAVDVDARRAGPRPKAAV